MRVNLGGGDVGMAEEGLDGADVGAVHKQISGEEVSHTVWCNLFANAGFDSVVLD